MSNDKWLNKLTKTISKTDLTNLKELTIYQEPDGSYRLFDAYTIRRLNESYEVEIDRIAGITKFNTLKNAVTWCTFYKKNNIYETNRILELDRKLAGVETAILVHQNLVKSAKNVDDKLTYLAKLIEEKMQRKMLNDELSGYIESSKIWQLKRFNTKSA
jgi:hypothetical protein